MVESEYSVLQESMTGYVPNSDDYSHLGYGMCVHSCDLA